MVTAFGGRTKQADNVVLNYLSDKLRTCRLIVISGDERAKITALAYSKAPEDHSNWTL